MIIQIFPDIVTSKNAFFWICCTFFQQVHSVEYHWTGIVDADNWTLPPKHNNRLLLFRFFSTYFCCSLSRANLSDLWYRWIETRMIFIFLRKSAVASIPARQGRRCPEIDKQNLTWMILYDVAEYFSRFSIRQLIRSCLSFRVCLFQHSFSFWCEKRFGEYLFDVSTYSWAIWLSLIFPKLKLRLRTLAICQSKGLGVGYNCAMMESFLKSYFWFIFIKILSLSCWDSSFFSEYNATYSCMSFCSFS